MSAYNKGKKAAFLFTLLFAAQAVLFLSGVAANVPRPPVTQQELAPGVIYTALLDRKSVV